MSMFQAIHTAQNILEIPELRQLTNKRNVCSLRCAHIENHVHMSVS